MCYDFNVAGPFVMECPGGGLGIPTDRDKRNWVLLKDPKNTLSLTEDPTKYLLKSQTLKNTLLRHDLSSRT